VAPGGRRSGRSGTTPLRTELVQAGRGGTRGGGGGGGGGGGAGGLAATLPPSYIPGSPAGGGGAPGLSVRTPQGAGIGDGGAAR
jgi:hypothetical protein